MIGLVLILLAPVYWATSRHYTRAAVLGTTAGLTVAAYYDWSDDSSGLFMVGVVLVMIGSLAVTAAGFERQTLPTDSAPSRLRAGPGQPGYRAVSRGSRAVIRSRSSKSWSGSTAGSSKVKAPSGSSAPVALS